MYTAKLNGLELTLSQPMVDALGKFLANGSRIRITRVAHYWEITPIELGHIHKKTLDALTSRGLVLKVMPTASSMEFLRNKNQVIEYCLTTLGKQLAQEIECNGLP